MNQQEEIKIIEVIHHLFDLNNKALFLVKAEKCPGEKITKELLSLISELGYQCFNELNNLVQYSKPKVLTVDEFVHTPGMGG